MFICMYIDFLVIQYLKSKIIIKKLNIIPKKYSGRVWLTFSIIVYFLVGKNVNVTYIAVYSSIIPFIDYFFIKK
jgi:hypothetical protein